MEVNMQNLEPYTLTVKGAAAYFGYHPQTIYKLIYGNKLQFGTHYLKVGGKILIKVKEFKKYLHEEAGLASGWEFVQLGEDYDWLNEQPGVAYGDD
jgi:excisionase family DNA binding protein